jgi:hypothetical protein
MSKIEIETSSLLKGVLVLALMIICGAGGYILGVSKSQKSIQVPAQSAYVAPTTAATSTQAATLPSAPVPSQEMATVVPSQDPIGKIFTMDMINAQVGYLEAITGPAWQQTDLQTSGLPSVRNNREWSHNEPWYGFRT